MNVIRCLLFWTYLDVLIKKPRAIRDVHASQSSDILDVLRRVHRKMRDLEGAKGSETKNGLFKVLILW